MAEADPQIAESDVTVVGPPRKRRWGRLALMLSLPLALLIGGYVYWQGQQGKVSTDNAYLQQDKVGVSAEIVGRIVQVNVKESQHVNAGDVLFRVDAEPYNLQIAQSNASIATAQASVATLRSAPELTGTDVAAARETLAFNRSTLARQQALWNRGFTTKADLQAAQHAVAQAQDEVSSAQAKQDEARAKLSTGSAVPGELPQIAFAEAQKASAQLNLRRTVVRAPMSGRVAQSGRLQIGQQAVTDLPMLTIVSDTSSFIEANFKETDLNAMRVGQPADIKFDAYKGVTLRGHVASIGAGTGSEFSAIPAQNATGNWVKVTQRVPVRIDIDQRSPRTLIAGLSATVTVFTDGKRH